MEIDPMPIVFKRLGYVAIPTLIATVCQRFLWGNVHTRNQDWYVDAYFTIFGAAILTAATIFIVYIVVAVLIWVMTGRWVFL